jgi:cytochrome c553
MVETLNRQDLIVLSSYTANTGKVRPVGNFATGRQSAKGTTAVCTNLKEKKAIMKTTKLAALILTIAVALFVLIPNLSWAADDGAALYKAKCAMCHGPNGEGKPAVKAPALKSDEVKKLSDEDLTHAFASKGVTPDQIKALVAHIRDLNK